MRRGGKGIELSQVETVSVLRKSPGRGGSDSGRRFEARNEKKKKNSDGKEGDKSLKKNLRALATGQRVARRVSAGVPDQTGKFREI